MSVLVLGVSALFGVAGGATGFGLAAWHGLQRMGTQLMGVNPDTVGKMRNPYVHGLAGVFIGAALGAGMGWALEQAQDHGPVAAPVTPVVTLAPR